MITLRDPELALCKPPPAHIGAEVFLRDKPIHARQRVRVPEERGESIPQRDERLFEAGEEQRSRRAEERDKVQAEQHCQEDPVELDGTYLLVHRGRLAEAVLHGGARNEDIVATA